MVHSSAFSTPTPWERLETSLKKGLDKSPESEELLEIKVCFGEIKTQFVRIQEERQKKGRAAPFPSTVVEPPKVTKPEFEITWGNKPKQPTQADDLELLYQNLDREFRKCSDAVIDMNARLRRLEGYEMPDRLRRMEACVGRLELNNVKDDPTVEYVE